MKAIRLPASPDGDIGTLLPDGSNLIPLLYQMHLNGGGKPPEQIEFALEDLFSNWRIVFKQTLDGRILLTVKKDDIVLYPQSIPDGFYSMLVMLVGIALKPKILLIDEVETSLHGKTIEYLISAFKTSPSTIIITTHSPLVIDAVELEDLILLEETQNGTTLRRVRNPEELKLQLFEKGVTPSESWLYAEL